MIPPVIETALRQWRDSKHECDTAFRHYADACVTRDEKACELLGAYYDIASNNVYRRLQYLQELVKEWRD